MHRLLTALQRGFKERIGWKRLGVVASLLIIAFAITTLIRTLKGVDTGVILIALTEKSPHQIAMAALCVIGAFCTLTFYDFFALRTIGKDHIPYRVAALSAFTSYTIGHNVGATVFTGGAIRFRIYSDYGLNAIDVAKVCFISGLTFWLGNLFVLGIGMAWHPWAASAMDLLPPSINRSTSRRWPPASRGSVLPGHGSGQRIGCRSLLRPPLDLEHPLLTRGGLGPRSALEPGEEAAEKDRLPLRLRKLGIANSRRSVPPRCRRRGPEVVVEDNSGQMLRFPSPFSGRAANNGVAKIRATRVEGGHRDRPQFGRRPRSRGPRPRPALIHPGQPLSVDCPLVDRAGGLGDRLGDRRVRVDDPRQLLVAALQLLDATSSAIMSQARLPTMWAPRISPYCLSTTSLTMPVAVVVDGAGADAAELELADLDVVAGLLGLPPRSCRRWRPADGRRSLRRSPPG